MNHLALFNGIGGFQLAAEWAGWNNIAHVEIDDFCNRVVAHHFPDSKCYLDIRDFNDKHAKKYEGTVDIISGGFPCQPYSQAGKRLGKDDERHLWPEMLRTIKIVRPGWVVGENVYGITNWNGGLVFEEVHTDLEAEGYEVWSYVLPASGVDAPHRRYRVWFVAYSKSFGNGGCGNKGCESFGEREFLQGECERGEMGCEAERCDSKRSTANANDTRTREQLRTDGQQQKKDKGRQGQPQPEFREISWDVTDTERSGSERKLQQRQEQGKFRGCNIETSSDTNSRRQPREEHLQKESGRYSEKSIPRNWENFPTQSPVRGRNDGIPKELDSITFPKWRNESIKAYGNAIVPQVAYQIFKAINEYEK